MSYQYLLNSAKAKCLILGLVFIASFTVCSATASAKDSTKSERKCTLWEVITGECNPSETIEVIADKTASREDALPNDGAAPEAEETNSPDHAGAGGSTQDDTDEEPPATPKREDVEEEEEEEEEEYKLSRQCTSASDDYLLALNRLRESSNYTASRHPGTARYKNIDEVAIVVVNFYIIAAHKATGIPKEDIPAQTSSFTPEQFAAIQAEFNQAMKDGAFNGLSFDSRRYLKQAIEAYIAFAICVQEHPAE